MNKLDIKILIVEDIRIERDLLKNLLDSFVNETLVAEDGFDAIEQYKTFKPDLIITDIRMHRMDGFELIAKIKSEFNPNQKFIIHTAYSEIENFKDAIELGVDSFIIKPPELEKIKEVVKKSYDSIKSIEHFNLYNKIFDNSKDGIALINEDGKIIEWNNACETIIGISFTEIQNKYVWEVMSSMSDNKGKEEHIKKTVLDALQNGQVPFNEPIKKCFRLKNGNEKIIEETISLINGSNSNLLIVNIRDITEITTKDRELQESIECASNVQNSIIPFKKEILNTEYFYMFLPRDIVSGDFMWHETIDNKLYLVLADCTGHGISGAFLSVLNIATLNNIDLRNISNPSEIISFLNNKLHNVINSEINRDGLDISAIIVDLKSGELNYSGANIPLFHFSNGSLISLDPDKISLGKDCKIDYSFKNHKILLKDSDTIYMFSDGYKDQFGGVKNKKYLIKNLLNDLREIGAITIKEQESYLINKFNEWKGTNSQTDDVSLLGLRFIMPLH